MPLTLEAIGALLVTTFCYGAAVGCLFFTLVIVSLMISQTSELPKARRRGSPVHLLVVLGSGGHTAEMIAILERHFNFSVYTYRTYVVSSGDALSAQKAVDFEAFMAGKNSSPKENHDYTVVTIPRARRVHQSYLTAPFSTLQCFWACLLVLLGRHPEQHPLPAEYKSSLPDIILANGPAVAVCMMLAAKSLRFLIFCFKWTRTQDPDSEILKLRTVYIESWARVRRLSMSGRILLPVADRFLVQWAPLAGLRAWWGMRPTIFCGWVVI
ncbi:UDP-N-acetylglucosamine transferase subunit alg14 [Penicillium diatomitis]|uniref:UDP-N-acetylglucosamine transferase subunit ALG14 n=1 Tax=Penicillium diatomitis TaxID=2819901 RepID=A0A9W9WUZ5_9EURO|nr:UDP-N-acetylglucosamine transferase subunit alg14 [Penicillium diatomitis]KAJ5477179.1 UDP-N-acetylglucosamine transferase subunit alg14 [Penicillium diatomitis]